MPSGKRMARIESKEAEDSTSEEDSGSPTSAASLERASVLGASGSLEETPSLKISSLEEDNTPCDSEIPFTSEIFSSGACKREGCAATTSAPSNAPSSLPEPAGLLSSLLQAENTATSSAETARDCIFFNVITDSTFLYQSMFFQRKMQ